jgi:hypothetical protein
LAKKKHHINDTNSHDDKKGLALLSTNDYGMLEARIEANSVVFVAGAKVGTPRDATQLRRIS